MDEKELKFKVPYSCYKKLQKMNNVEGWDESEMAKLLLMKCVIAIDIVGEKYFYDNMNIDYLKKISKNIIAGNEWVKEINYSISEKKCK